MKFNFYKIKRPYNLKNFQEYRKSIPYFDGYKDKLLDPEYFPCKECCGRGWYHSFEDRDPIEGYKLAPKTTCADCKGKGTILKKVLYEHYKNDLEKFEKERDEIYTKHKKLKQIIKKLTKKEWNFLMKYRGEFGDFKD